MDYNPDLNKQVEFDFNSSFVILRSAVGSTKLIGQLLWALFIVIQSVFCFGLFVYMFIGT